MTLEAANKLEWQPQLLPIAGPSAVPIGCVRWSRQGHALVVHKDLIRIITPSLGIHPSVRKDSTWPGDSDESGEVMGSHHSSISVTDSDPSYERTLFDGDLGCVGNFWRVAWKDARWISAPAGSSSSGTAILALNSELEASVYVPELDPRHGKWNLVIKLDPLHRFSTELNADKRLQARERSSTAVKQRLEELDRRITCIGVLQQPGEGNAEQVYLLAGTASGKVLIWSWNPIKQKRVPKAVLYLSKSPLMHITSHFSPAAGGTTIACYAPEESAVHTVRLKMSKDEDWEVTSLVNHTLSPPKFVSSLCISSSGNTVAVGLPGTVMVLEVEEEDQKPFWIRLEHAANGFESDELLRTATSGMVRESLKRPRSAFSPVVELLPHPSPSGSDERFRLLLQNGLLYSLPVSGASKRRKVAADSHLIIQPASTSTDVRRALASMQRVDGWATRDAAAAAPIGGGTSALETRRVPCRLILAARPGDDPTPLKIDTVKTESCLAMAVETPVRWTLNALVEDVLDILASSASAAAAGNASVTRWNPLHRLEPILLAHATLKPASRVAFRDKLAAALVAADQGRYTGVAKWLKTGDRTLVWILTWLHWPVHCPRERADVALLHKAQSHAQAGYIESLVTGKYKELLREAAADRASEDGKQLLKRIAAAVAVSSELGSKLGPTLSADLDQALPKVTVGEVDLDAGEASTTTAKVQRASTTTPFAPLASASPAPQPALVKTPAVSTLVQGEKCLACSDQVPFAPAPGSELLTFAMCMRGHQWERCAATFRLITTPHAKRCGTCLSKVLFEEDVDDLIEKELLERVGDACTLCKGPMMSF